MYWADVTLFTVGYGDYSPATTLGRGLLIPYALIGVTSLGLVIGSIRSLVLDRGKRRLDVRMLEKKRRQLIRRVTQKGDESILEPIKVEALGASAQAKDERVAPAELERRRKEFSLMRKIQRQVSVRRRWTAMATSTITWIVLWLVGARIFQAFEAPYQGWTYFDAFYFAYTGLTTIGYGDITPVSNGGKSFFVFWSLLALPTMTVFISNAGDTIVKIIKDGTLRLGNLTILPGEEDIKQETKQLLGRLSFGTLFRSDEDIEEYPPGFLGAAQPSTTMTEDDDDEDEEESNKDDENTPATTGSFNQVPEFASNQKLTGQEEVVNRKKGRPGQKRQQQHRGESALDISGNSGKQDTPLELPKTRAEYHLLLIDEIARVTRHLQHSPPRKYTYKEVRIRSSREWIVGAWYRGVFYL